MDLGFAEMPTTARVSPPAPLRHYRRHARRHPRRRSPRAAARQPVATAVADAGLALGASDRPLPRAEEDGSIARNSASDRRRDRRGERRSSPPRQATRNAPAAIDPNRPMPRPGMTPRFGRCRGRLGLHLLRRPHHPPGAGARERRPGLRRQRRHGDDRRERMGRAARRLPRQGRRRTSAAHHRPHGRARTQRRAPPRRGREDSGRDGLPRAVRRPQPGERARSLRDARPAAVRLPAAGARVSDGAGSQRPATTLEDAVGTCFTEIATAEPLRLKR